MDNPFDKDGNLTEIARITDETDWTRNAKPEKLPLICRMCKAGLVKYFCKVCPPVSAEEAPMSDEEAHILNKNMRYDSEAAGIVSNVDPETEKYFADLAKKMGIKPKETDNG